MLMNRRGFLQSLLVTVAVTTGLARSASVISTGYDKTVVDTFVVTAFPEERLSHQVIVFDDGDEQQIPYEGEILSIDELNVHISEAL